MLKKIIAIFITILVAYGVIQVLKPEPIIPDEILGNPDTIDLLPDAEGTRQEWDYSFGPTSLHWKRVDDPVGSPDEDSTYVYTGIDSEVEDFNHKTSALLTGATITDVKLTIRARKTVAVHVIRVDLGLRIGGRRFPGVFTPDLTTSYADHSTHSTNNPSDGEAWEKSDIDDLESSLMSAISGVINPQLRVTQVYFTITYEPADTCTCPSPAADWHVDSDDNCNLTSDCNIAGYTLTLNWTGTGQFSISSDSQLWVQKIESAQTPMNVAAGCKIHFK